MSDDLTYEMYTSDTGDLATMDSIKRTELLDGVQRLGMLEAASAQIGLTMDMVADAIQHDPRLEADIEIAMGRYKASILERMTDLAFRGSEKAIVGGKNKDQILGVDVIPNDKALDIISRMQFGDELAIVTRQRIKTDIAVSSADAVKADFTGLDRDERKQLEALFQKARSVVEKEGS